MTFLEKCADLIDSRPELGNLDSSEKASLAKEVCRHMAGVFIGYAKRDEGFAEWLACYPNVRDGFAARDDLAEEARKDLESLERRTMLDAFVASGLGRKIRADAGELVSAMRWRGMLTEELGVKRDIPESLRNFPDSLAGLIVVHSSNGPIAANPDGTVVALGGDWPDEPLAPLKFDFDEWKRYWHAELIRGDLDILDVGYATACGSIIPPAMDWREEFMDSWSARDEREDGNRASARNNGASDEKEQAMDNLTDEQKAMIERLSEEALDYAWRLQDHKFRAKDAERHLEVLYPEITASPEEIDELIEMFYDNQDCNIPENETWSTTIEDWVANQRPSPAGC